MDVMIKESGMYKKVSLDDIIQGLNGGVTVVEDVKTIPYYPGILEVEMTGSDYRVYVHEKNINRRMELSNKSGILDKMANDLNMSQNGNVRGQLGRLANEWGNTNDLQYVTRKGFILHFNIEKKASGYQLRKDTAKMARDRTEIQQGTSKLLYPNIYNDTKMCWGNTPAPMLTGLKETGKVATTFFTSKSNMDLSGKTIQGVKWTLMLNELARNISRVDQEYRGEMEQIINRLCDTPWGANVSVRVYLIIFFANLFKFDMDWMHARLYGN